MFSEGVVGLSPAQSAPAIASAIRTVMWSVPRKLDEASAPCPGMLQEDPVETDVTIF